MKRKLLISATAVLLCVVTLLSTSCSILDALEEYVNDIATETKDDIGTYAPPQTEAQTTAPDSEHGIPLPRPPEVSKVKLPDEDYKDPLEREASEIIDGAIGKALGCINVMKDDRHSFVSYGFEEDANGYIAALSDKNERYYRRFVEAGRKLESYTLTDKDYGGDLKELYFAIYVPMTYCEPGVASYMGTDAKTHLNSSDMTSYYSSIFTDFYDADKDQNARVRDGAATIDEVKRQAELLDRVVKRVVRFMPDGLSTYDKYYYLAVVLSEQVKYDSRPDNCFTAYGALVGGKAVCEGYTSAYYLLCREANLWCAYRNGQPEGVGHTWNMVKIDSGIYNVDVTWCDGYGVPYEKSWYDCFMKSDEAFENDGHAATSGVEGTGAYEPCPYER